MIINKISKKQRVYVFAAAGLIAVAFLISSNINKLESALGGKTIIIKNNSVNNETIDNNNEENNNEEIIKEEKKEKSLINGTECDNAKKRPFAVMLAGDLEAWPLSGISQADLVIEMPVVTGGITRYMAVFGCNNPADIGSIRSARHDFIPLAMGFDAIFAHWGGSHFALDKLNNKIMDNVNALYLDGTVFYRKPGFLKPHDGFTNIERLDEYSKRVGYRMESQFEGYKFYDSENPIDKNGKLSIGYPHVYEVEYEYSFKENSYLRSKGGKEDKDKLTSKRISAKNVVIMFAASRQIEGQYNDTDIEGEGGAIVYQNGWEIKGKWKKDKTDMKSKLYFYNESGEEIKFVPGQIWIQVIQPNQEVKWNLENE